MSAGDETAPDPETERWVWGSGRMLEFHDPRLLAQLEILGLDEIDEFDFGLVVMNRSGTVLGYNSAESARSGISPQRVLDRNFFLDVGPCTNNYLIAQRYLDEPELDATLDYVFTLRMRPTPVELRLLARAGSPRQYLAVRDR